jgi:hypothetical protein
MTKFMTESLRRVEIRKVEQQFCRFPVGLEAIACIDAEADNRGYL